MCELTTEQTDAIATFKHSLHLPGGGFHALIVELCREFQLPFQVVRSVLKQAQASIETKIRNQFDDVVASDLTKEHQDMEILSTKNDIENEQIDSVKIASVQEWHKNIKKDVYVYEATEVLNDLSKEK